MDISTLIEEGKKILPDIVHQEHGICICEGPSYEAWLRKTMRYLESHYPNEKDTRRFCDIASTANGKFDGQYNSLMSILEAMQEIPAQAKLNENDTVELIIQICENFGHFDRTLNHRHDNRTSLEITDEYDVQDALHAILKLFVKDIRAEEDIPSHAGANSRADFFLPEAGIIIETKMTNRNLKDKNIGEQLLLDCQRYQNHQGATHLICFVYDKEHWLSNPDGIKRDLEAHGNEKLTIDVVISS